MKSADNNGSTPDHDGESESRIDEVALGELKDLLGDELSGIVEQFLSSLDDDLNALDDALKQNDLPEAGRLAHALKGSAGNLGLSGLAACATDLERIARDSDGEPPSRAFHTLQLAVTGTVLRLEALGITSQNKNADD